MNGNQRFGMALLMGGLVVAGVFYGLRERPLPSGSGSIAAAVPSVPTPQTAAPTASAPAPLAPGSPAPELVRGPAPVVGSPAIVPIEPEAPAAPEDEDEAGADDWEPTEHSVWSPTRDGIDGAIAEVNPELMECLHGWGSEYGSLEGQIVAHFNVSPDPEDAGIGRITDFVADAPAATPALTSCMASVLSGLQFDPPADGVLAVSYPIRYMFIEEDDIFVPEGEDLGTTGMVVLE